ncbi:MAG: hypothetical protein A2X87_01095 [Deltaproteobacteria bacterium GWC2_42_51]|nr:MAG: hypothetical protein A2056_03435 [Deltaproteobacteria bacterium GWA2_42_85]OGP34540.1 MAG: hypothetical protein A2X87_01095 [Deltaproteobacteria bacterium GWC2_42_51]OGP44067.1 MAG: hypothetical protein A2090_06115 [Deltaproteobacteria bacterium GWD2_42_10]OGP46725.1 MAG: hypothetical protein A2022_05370 [Deltaproteobacteria bacterium GWF2_42_12]OGQ26875.1 MAG: hypothetical protein A3D29_05950 [Deltaproteobacteria bacterium RIFCSPHIGHO2_02_FULL_42_44]OGQ38396.1 MAG: hypothetical protei
MKQQSETFGLAFENIPIINLRNEFARYYAVLNDKNFLSQFEGPIKPIETPYMVWHGMPDDLITMIMQRVILGVEAYLPSAVFYELGMRGKLNKNNLPYLRNPFEFGGRSTVDNYYDKLPSLIDKSLSLKSFDNELWSQTKAFYKEVRNPIFHGKNISNRDIEGLKKVFIYLSQIYKWIDNWHDYSQILSNKKK